MDFTVALLQRLEDEEGSENQSLAQLVEAAYKVSLKPWHGWIASAASKVGYCSIFSVSIFTSSNKTGKADTRNCLYFAETDRNEAYP
jgi:hypothetical protein